MRESKKHRRIRMLAMFVLAIVVLLPFFMVLIISLKTESDFAKTSYVPTLRVNFANYAKVWRDGRIPQAATTGVILTAGTIVAQIVAGSLAAYALVKMRFKRAGLFSGLFMIPLVFSVQTVIFPIFLLYKYTGLLNTHIGLIIIYTATGLATTIFIFSKSFKSISYELSEAAMIDGASHLRIYWRVLMPMSKAQVSTIAIINGMGVWNDFFLPLMLYTNGRITTLPLSMFNFTSEYGMKWTLISADIILAMLPMLIIYVLLQRYIVEGVAAGSVKG